MPGRRPGPWPAVGVAAQTAEGPALKEVTVSDQAEAIGGLQKTYAGGQIARGGDLGILGKTDQMNVPFSTTNYTSELNREPAGADHLRRGDERRLGAHPAGARRLWR